MPLQYPYLVSLWTACFWGWTCPLKHILSDW
jgi:hypothetical protein